MIWATISTTASRWGLSSGWFESASWWFRACTSSVISCDRKVTEQGRSCHVVRRLRAAGNATVRSGYPCGGLHLDVPHGGVDLSNPVLLVGRPNLSTERCTMIVFHPNGGGDTCRMSERPGGFSKTVPKKSG